jgi:acetyltransferase-like isoleucine patch superfamily enzyme
MSTLPFLSWLNNRAFIVACRLFQAPRILFYRLISSPIVAGKPTLNQPLLAIGKGKIKISKNVSIGYFPSPNYFSSYSHIEARNRGSVISIGEGTVINNSFSAIAEHTSITIGKNVLIGVNVEVIDSDFHGINVSERNLSKPEWAKSVRIENDVFIGSNVRILKGVTIGKGAIVANSAVVVSDIPAHAVASGNPAKILKYLPDA